MQVAVTEIAALKLSSDEGRAARRFEFGRYAAHALMMHAGALRAQRARYDVDVLCSRFGVSFEQAANPAPAMLQRAGASPSCRSSCSGRRNCRQRFTPRRRKGFPHSRFGGGCPKLPVHAPSPTWPDLRRERSRCRTAPSSSPWRARWKGRRVRSRSGARRHPARLRHRLPAMRSS